MKQLDLFGEEVMTRRKKPMGGSSNPIVFKDYDSLLSVAKANEKQRAKERVREKARGGIPISLSEREKRMIDKLG